MEISLSHGNVVIINLQGRGGKRVTAPCLTTSRFIHDDRGV